MDIKQKKPSSRLQIFHALTRLQNLLRALYLCEDGFVIVVWRKDDHERLD